MATNAIQTKKAMWVWPLQVHSVKVQDEKFLLEAGPHTIPTRFAAIKVFPAHNTKDAQQTGSHMDIEQFQC